MVSREKYLSIRRDTMGFQISRGFNLKGRYGIAFTHNSHFLGNFIYGWNG
ncbi:hypothetical protein X975_23350, partial [Stegodyphus mimosarum]